MPHVLNITDGTTTVSLTTGNVMLTHYVPQSPKPKGNEYEDVTEPIEFMLYGAATTDVQAIGNSIDALIVSARRRQATGVGPRVYLQYQPINDSTLYRSEIVDGVPVAWANDAMTAWVQAKANAHLTVTRRPWWDGSLTEASISSQASGSPATGGKSIANCKDSTRGNYVQFAAPSTGWTLPTPAKLQLKNTSGSAQDYRNIFLGVNAFTDPTNFSHIVEGESVVGGWGTVVTGQSTCSNGGYVTQTFSNSTDFRWALNSTLLSQAAGRDFRLLTRFSGYSSTPQIYVTPKLRDSAGLIPLAVGQEIALPTSAPQLWDLGTLPIPPGGWNTNWGAAQLGLSFRVAGTVTVNIDYTQLTGLDSYKKLIQRGYSVSNNDSIVNDDIEDQMYVVSGGVNLPIYTAQAGPLMIFPGVTQRIYILHDEGSSSDITNTFSAQLWYRPRRLTI